MSKVTVTCECGHERIQVQDAENYYIRVPDLDACPACGASWPKHIEHITLPRSLTVDTLTFSGTSKTHLIYRGVT